MLQPPILPPLPLPKPFPSHCCSLELSDSHAPPTRQANSAEELACRRYRRKSGEEALVERKAKMRRLSVSMEYFVKSEGRTSHRLHYQYLRRQQNRLVQPASQCTQMNCDNKCLAHSVKCSRRILTTRVVVVVIIDTVIKQCMISQKGEFEIPFSPSANELEPSMKILINLTKFNFFCQVFL